MKYAVVAVAQQGLHVYTDIQSYRQGIERFFRLAETKHARLLIFPERTGLMVIPPLIEDFRTDLLKRAEAGKRGRNSWWQRARGGLMRGTARLLKANLPAAIRQAMEEMADFIWQHYVNTFAELAYEYKVTVVAGSGYFLDPTDRKRRHVATIFGPDGDVLGQQAQVMVPESEREWVEPGTSWQVFDTPVGRLGITFGEEILYPEVGRWLAYQGAEAVVTLLATPEEKLVAQVRDGLWARVMDNQIFGALACTVGPDPFLDEEPPTYRGRSAIFAPHGLTPRYNGVLVEAGTATAEVLLTTRWDFAALRKYWESATIPVRRRIPVGGVAKVLAALYEREVTLEEATRALPERGPRALPREEAPEEPAAAPAPGEEAAVAAAATGAVAAAATTEEAAPTPAASQEITPPPAEEGVTAEAPPAPEEPAPARPPTPEPVEEALPTAAPPEGEPPPLEEAPTLAVEPSVAEAPSEPAEALPETSAPTAEPAVEPEAEGREEPAAEAPEAPEERAPAIEEEEEPPPAEAPADLTPEASLEETPAQEAAEPEAPTDERAVTLSGEPEPSQAEPSVEAIAPPQEETSEKEREEKESSPSPPVPEAGVESSETSQGSSPAPEMPSEDEQEGTPPSLSAVVARREALETSETREPTRGEEAPSELPESLWASVKSELERAAQVLRSLSQEEPPAPPPAPPEHPPATSPPSSTSPDPSQQTSTTGKGWFHQLLQRERTSSSRWDEF